MGRLTPACSLCSPDLGPLLAESAHWRLILNHNQNLLGKCFLVLRRHQEAVPDVTAAEWAELQRELARATRALAAAFRPDHVNYAFLQNQDRHVHLHIIPRYASPRSFGVQVFADPDYPGHYAVPSPARRLAPPELAGLTAALREALFPATGRDAPG
jgi:diadenosine tetraphosphate (Ap4A) HIT family hydrolase